MKRTFTSWLLVALLCLAIMSQVKQLHAVETQGLTTKTVLKPCVDMQRAELYSIQTVDHPKAILVLSPGCNGSGEGWIRQPRWREFAVKHELGLVGLSFASDTALLTNGRGYYYASHGSGQLLLDAVDKLYGSAKPLPLILFGFSGGAHFTSRFTEWKPDRVLTWCAYSAGWWDKPEKAACNPPGLVICGDHDERYGASLIYFKQGRATGKPWLWLSIAKSGHTITPEAEGFVRNYFEAVLDQQVTSGANAPRGVWIDIDQKTEVTSDTLQSMPSVTGWLPAPELQAKWNQVHAP